MKSYRRITSLTALIAFIMVIITFLVLYIVPQGRIANWADWRLIGLSKEQWGAIHTNMGTLFLIAIGFHIYFNWTPIKTYFKDKKKKLNFKNKEFGISLLICLVITLGTYMELPPFSSYLGFSESIKEQAVDKYGNPPYGHAELSSLKTFVKKTNLNLNKSIDLLKTNGINIETTDQTLLSIAEHNKVSPQAIYNLIKDAKIKSDTISLPEEHPAGLGKRTIADLCQEFGLNIEKVVTGLKQKGWVIDEDQTFKDVAANYSISPFEVYEKIQEIYEK